MSANPSTASARSQLSALAAAGTEDLAARFGVGGVESRPASVLILFGVLDAFPSHHDARAAAVSRDLDVLLLARATSLRAHPGQIAFPGGRVDPEDDGPVSTALREAQEETGLDPAGVEVLGALHPLPLVNSQHLVTPVLAWWQQPSPVHVVDEQESAHVFRVPVADLLNPRHRGVTVLQRGRRRWRGPAFEIHHESGDHVLWGFTAMLLDGLFDRLGWTEPWDESRTIALPSVI